MKRTILVCNSCNAEVDSREGGIMRFNYSDARKGSKVADLCPGCAGELPGKAVPRRGRKPKEVAA